MLSIAEVEYTVCMLRSALFLAMAIFIPLILYAQAVPEEYRDEVRAVLLSGYISPEITSDEFETFVDVLSDKAYSANVTGADITSARVEALLGAAAGFDGSVSAARTIREPNVGALWGTVAFLILIGLIARYYRRMHQGGALGHT